MVKQTKENKYSKAITIIFIAIGIFIIPLKIFLREYLQVSDLINSLALIVIGLVISRDDKNFLNKLRRLFESDNKENGKTSINKPIQSPVIQSHGDKNKFAINYRISNRRRKSKRLKKF